MAFTQRVQFTASPAWTASGSLSESDIGISYGAARMRLEGSQSVDGTPRQVFLEISAQVREMLPGLSPDKQYRVTIEEVT